MSHGDGTATLRVMQDVQIRSIEDPIADIDLETLSDLIEIVLRMDSMGLLEQPVERLDGATVRELRRIAIASGLARGSLPELGDDRTLHASDVTERVRRVVATLREALDGSPLPVLELPALTEILGPESTAALLGVSHSSLRRYVAGARTPPDDVADRAHVLTGIVSDLRGTYNDVGVRRWFERPRSALGGAAPAAILSGSWTEDSPGVADVRQLARNLTAPIAT